MKQKQIVNGLIHRAKGGEKYPEHVRQFCITMNYHSPRAYEFLRESFDNHLPHTSTIRSWYANSDLNTLPSVINEQCLNILQRKVNEKSEKGEKLICGITFDEMNIRKHIQWSNKERKFTGYSSLENDSQAKQKSNIANQALVFIVTAVNDSFQLPIAYYFICSMDGHNKKALVEKIVHSLMDCGIVVSHITFDGAQANKTMCKLFGAELNVYSPFFKPYIRIRNKNVYIFFDVCHMLKLVRNRLATNEILFDYAGNEIRWQHVVDLAHFNSRGLNLPNKLNQSHIDWKNKKMKVDLAAQTLSESTASSLEFLMKKGVEEFMSAEPTVKFTRMFNNLFDVLNTKDDQKDNLFKRALCNENATQIFHLFENAIRYIKGLKVMTKDKKKIAVCRSRIQTGFRGFIINMVSLKLMFEEYVVEKQITIMLKTYCFQQDPIEIFFGTKIYCDYKKFQIIKFNFAFILQVKYDR